MGTSYREPGNVLPFTAPAGDVEKGVPVLIGNMIVIPLDDADEGDQFRGALTGIHTVPKTGSEEWTVGALVYLDSTAQEFTTSSTGNYPAGIAVEAVDDGAGSIVGVVRLNGCAVVAAS